MGLLRAGSSSNLDFVKKRTSKRTQLLMAILALGAVLAVILDEGIHGASAGPRPQENSTPDVILGPKSDPATLNEWREWYAELNRARTTALEKMGLPLGRYDDAATAWSDGGFRQLFLFIYDQSFLKNGKYRTAEWLAENQRRLGKIDSVLLWQAYPQLGIDSRDQFDFYRGLPGGLQAVRSQVSDVLHAQGVRVFLDFNPWDSKPDYEELAAVVSALDADGVMLDTMGEVPPAMREAVARRKAGVVFSPERKPEDSELISARSSWAQWYDIGDGGGAERPAIYREKWLLPQHMQFAIRRWDTDRKRDIVFSFFNGSGMLLWDNVFGSWNPYQAPDRRLLAETAVVLDEYRDLLTREPWTPLLPSAAKGLDVNRWEQIRSERAIYTFRNRTDETLRFRVPQRTGNGPHGLAYFAFWGMARGQVEPGVEITIEPHGTQALVLDNPAHARKALERFQSAGLEAGRAMPEYEKITPVPALNRSPSPPRHALVPDGFSVMPGGDFEMLIEHSRRECGCYSEGATPNALWGWYFQDLVTHRMAVKLPSFAIKSTAVTNAEYLSFVHQANYRPADPDRFLEQIPRLSDGELPPKVSSELGSLPVTFVSLQDARAYAEWRGERLPTEAEWQWSAQGGTAQTLWPWGNTPPESVPEGTLNRSGKLARADGFIGGATSQGVRGLTGNTWELTESEWNDGHDRFVMLRGGTYRRPDPALSEWMLPRGAHSNTFHAKYLLLSDGMDRSEAIGFRTIVVH
jgi:iron(II)-dependent oxidoreductase